MGAVVDMFFLCFSSRTLPSSICSLCCCACGSRRAKNVASRVCHCHVILSPQRFRQPLRADTRGRGVHTAARAPSPSQRRCAWRTRSAALRRRVRHAPKWTSTAVPPLPQRAPALPATRLSGRCATKLLAFTMQLWVWVLPFLLQAGLLGVIMYSVCAFARRAALPASRHVPLTLPDARGFAHSWWCCPSWRATASTRTTARRG
jgi:hypothetical protein